MRKSGFTIIEFMIVVAIIVIMALIAIPMYQKRQEEARNDAALTFLKEVDQAEVARWKAALTAGRSVPDEGFLFVAAAADAEAVAKLAAHKLRLDPNVGFVILKPAGGPGFVALAANRAPGSRLYIYDSLAAAEPELYDGTKAYAVAADDIPGALLLFTQAGEMEIDHDDDPDTPKIKVPGVEPAGDLAVDKATARVM